MTVAAARRLRSAATTLGHWPSVRLIDRDRYIVAGITDHICPWQSCYRSTQLLAGHNRFVLSTSGHVAAMVNPPGNDKARYQVARDCPEDPQDWGPARRDLPRLLVAGLRGLAGRALR
jgi:polyhydroxyalkanoate synthase